MSFSLDPDVVASPTDPAFAAGRSQSLNVADDGSTTAKDSAAVAAAAAAKPAAAVVSATGSGDVKLSAAPAAAHHAPHQSTSAAVTAVGLQPAVNAHCHVLVDLKFADQTAVSAFMKVIGGHFYACRKEPGLVSIHLLQSTKDALHFTIKEEYTSLAGFLAHKETAHYKHVWPQAKAHVQVAVGEMYQTVL